MYKKVILMTLIMTMCLTLVSAPASGILDKAAEHAYDRVSSAGINMTFSDGADLTKEKEQRIVKTIIQTQAELHRASQNSGEDVSEEAARKLLEKSKWFEDRIKELQSNRK